MNSHDPLLNSLDAPDDLVELTPRVAPRDASSNRSAHGKASRSPQRFDPFDAVERTLRGEEGMLNPTLQDLLDQIERDGMEQVTKRANRDEYLRMIRHFAMFLERYGKELTTADRNHVKWFKAHLEGTDAVAQKLTSHCAYCQASNRRTNTYSASYVKRHLAALKAAYEVLVGAKLVAADPAATVKRPKVEVSRGYVPSEADVRRLFDHPGTARSRLLIRLAYYAPARRAELARMRWTDIDEGRWYYRGKHDKEHCLRLHPELIRALRHYRSFQEQEASRHPAMRVALLDPKHAYVFLTRNGKSITPGHLARILKRHAVRAGVGVMTATATATDPKTGQAWDCINGKTSRLSPHAMRRGWACHALNAPGADAVPIDVVSKVLNHANIETTRRHYAFTDDARADDALMKRRLD